MPKARQRLGPKQAGTGHQAQLARHHPVQLQRAAIARVARHLDFTLQHQREALAGGVFAEQHGVGGHLKGRQALIPGASGAGCTCASDGYKSVSSAIESKAVMRGGSGRNGVTFFGNGLGQGLTGLLGIHLDTLLLRAVGLLLQRMRSSWRTARTTAFSQCSQVMPVTVKICFISIPSKI